jgi:hypothetical protein
MYYFHLKTFYFFFLKQNECFGDQVFFECFLSKVSTEMLDCLQFKSKDFISKAHRYIFFRIKLHTIDIIIDNQGILISGKSYVDIQIFKISIFVFSWKTQSRKLPPLNYSRLKEEVQVTNRIIIIVNLGLLCLTLHKLKPNIILLFNSFFTFNIFYLLHHFGILMTK